MKGCGTDLPSTHGLMKDLEGCGFHPDCCTVLTATHEFSFEDGFEVTLVRFSFPTGSILDLDLGSLIVFLSPWRIIVYSYLSIF